MLHKGAFNGFIVAGQYILPGGLAGRRLARRSQKGQEELGRVRRSGEEPSAVKRS